MYFTTFAKVYVLVYKLRPSQWQAKLLRRASRHLHQRLSCRTLVTEAACILRSDCEEGVLDHEMVLVALTQCQVGADVCTRSEAVLFLLGEALLFKLLGEPGSTQSLTLEVVVDGKSLCPLFAALNRCSFLLGTGLTRQLSCKTRARTRTS